MMGSLHPQFTTMEKAQKHAETGSKIQTWKKHGVTFRLLAPPKVHDNGNLEVFVTADGLPLDGIDSFLFYRPPCGEDMAASFKRIVEEAVFTAARIRGWDG